jgi:hypothetical protein
MSNEIILIHHWDYQNKEWKQKGFLTVAVQLRFCINEWSAAAAAGELILHW